MNTTELTKQKIDELLEALPQENLLLVQRFIEFLREQARQGRPIVEVVKEDAPPYRYPTVAVLLSTLEGMIDLMPAVGGDALADTEALYDEV